MNSSIQRILVFLIIAVFEMSTQQNMRVAPGVPPQHYDPNFQHPPPGYQQQPPPPQYQQQQQPQYGQQQVHVQQPMGHVQQPAGHIQQPAGHVPQVPIGQVPVGQVPVGQVPVGQVPVGQVPVGQVPHQAQQPAHGHGQPPAHGHHGQHHGQLLDASNVAKERQHIQEHMDVPIDTSQMSEQELQFHYFKMHDADNNNKLDGCELVKSLIHWHDHEGEGESNSLEDDQLSTVVDQVLDYDVNRDGMIDYPEFVTAQNLAQKKEEKKKCATCRD